MLLLIWAACAVTPVAPDPDHWQEIGHDAWLAGEPARLDLIGILSQETWLDELSPWGARGLPDGRETAGSWGVGNGRVFGLIGLDDPWNTLTNLIGPGYQRSDGFFGDVSVTLAGRESTEEAVQRPVGTAVVRTQTDHEDTRLQTFDVADPDQDRILRHVVLDGPGLETLRWSIGIDANAGESLTPLDGGWLQWRGDRWLWVGCPGHTLVDQDGGLHLTVDLSAASPWEATCVLQFGEGTPTPPTEAPDIVSVLDRSRQETQTLLDEAATLSSGDRAPGQLLEGQLISLFTQTDAASGVVSPMNRYTSGWLRDADGPVRLFLATGLHERAAAVLDAGYQAALDRQAINNSWSLDRATGASEPADPAAFWAAADFMSGREAVEAPSYPVLHHALLARATGDWNLSASRLAYLEACVHRQTVDEDGFMTFSGDETFRWPFSWNLGGAMPEEVGWSANSAFLFVAASEAIESLGGTPDPRAEQVRDATERHFFVDGSYRPLVRFDDLSAFESPTEDVSPMAAWSGYPAGEGRLASTADVLAEMLLTADGTVLTNEGAAGGEGLVTTGMGQGYVLAALAGHQDLGRAVSGVDVLATPSGHFEEVHWADHTVVDLGHDRDGLGADAAARYRPWEGGVVTAALLDALIGQDSDPAAGTLGLAPHLPDGWAAFAAEDLRHGDERFDLTVEGFEEGCILTLFRQEGAGPDWQVEVAVQGPAWVREERTDEDGVVTASLGPGDGLTIVVERRP